MKACINCKYFLYDKTYTHNFTRLSTELCTHPSALVDVDKVSGLPKYVAASNHRNYDFHGRCGPSGKYFTEESKIVLLFRTTYVIFWVVLFTVLFAILLVGEI